MYLPRFKQTNHYNDRDVYDFALRFVYNSKVDKQKLSKRIHLWNNQQQ